VADARGVGTLGRWFAGESTSEVGLRSGVRRDLWTVVEPDLQPFRRMISGIDERFPLAGADMEPLFLKALAERYTLQPPRAAFRLIVAPLVMWVWIGGVVALLGAVVAIWPARRHARRAAGAPATVPRTEPAAVLERV
jgi:cytochrome c-type biogenesis protein CcmF